METLSPIFDQTLPVPVRFDEGGWVLPPGETHLQEWMLKIQDRRGSRLLYQGHKYRAALEWVRPERRVAIDIGAHVGLWSWQMAQDFTGVHAFEPHPVHRDCFRTNVPYLNTALHPFALGPRAGRAAIATRTLGSSGDTGIEPEGLPVEMRTLDSFHLDQVDFIKIDCEGYELFVLQGAAETLEAHRPCVIVEQKPETGLEDRYGVKAGEACLFLEDLGAKRRAGIQGDFIYSWDA